MRTELEEKDIELIAQKVAELLKSLLPGRREEDCILDIDGLSKYLQVHPSWVYKMVASKKIPYIKAGKYVRFKKSAIDKWLDTQAIRPIPLEGKRRPTKFKLDAIKNSA